MPDELVCVFQKLQMDWDFCTQPSLGFKERRSSVCVTIKALEGWMEVCRSPAGNTSGLKQMSCSSRNHESWSLPGFHWKDTFESRPAVLCKVCSSPQDLCSADVSCRFFQWHSWNCAHTLASLIVLPAAASLWQRGQRRLDETKVLLVLISAATEPGSVRETCLQTCTFTYGGVNSK